jgi:UrcA family protein
MTGITTQRSAARMLFTAAVLASMANSALAQTSESPGKEIVVEAPRTLRLPVKRSPYSGAAMVVTTVKITARYGDLDLARPAEALRLTARVKAVAQDACKELDRLHPLSPDHDCVAMAVARARPDVEAAVAAATN